MQRRIRIQLQVPLESSGPCFIGELDDHVSRQGRPLAVCGDIPALWAARRSSTFAVSPV